jgi:hypothetical protein
MKYYYFYFAKKNLEVNKTMVKPLRQHFLERTTHENVVSPIPTWPPGERMWASNSGVEEAPRGAVLPPKPNLLVRRAAFILKFHLDLLPAAAACDGQAGRTAGPVAATP